MSYRAGNYIKLISIDGIFEWQISQQIDKYFLDC